MQNIADVFNLFIGQGMSCDEVYLLWCKRDRVSPRSQIDIGLATTKLKTKGYLNSTGDFTKKSLDLFNMLGRPNVMNVDALADKIRELYPKIQLYDQSARSSITDTKKKLIDFFKKYKSEIFTFDEVVKATEYYVQTCKEKSFDRMKLLKYFILKDDMSLLAEEILKLREGFEEEVVDDQYKIS